MCLQIIWDLIEISSKVHKLFISFTIMIRRCYQWNKIVEVTVGFGIMLITREFGQHFNNATRYPIVFYCFTVNSPYSLNFKTNKKNSMWNFLVGDQQRHSHDLRRCIDFTIDFRIYWIKSKLTGIHDIYRRMAKRFRLNSLNVEQQLSTNEQCSKYPWIRRIFKNRKTNE